MSELLQLGSRNERPSPPKPEDLTLRFGVKAIAELEALKTHYPEWKACVLPALWIAQREYEGYLSGEAIAEVAYRLKRSYAEVEGVATFYSMYNLAHQPGRHKIEVCTCLTCAVCGAYRVWDYLKAKLGVDNGETTPDGMFTIEEVECLDACDRAPVLQVGPRYIGPVDEKGIDDLLDRLRNTQDSTVIRLADEVVQTQLAASDKEGIRTAVTGQPTAAPWKPGSRK
ncbi:MAG: NADH-quinone oxidoreductase subunit [Fimbriimonadaceae bacterium]|nr:NADH-quinone oxidoreductase subunit [Fimbriimonadaceae bacterium]